MTDACPVCEASLVPMRGTPRLALRRCARCGHLVARRLVDAPPSADVHTQYDDDSFLRSLERTRRRQAATIVARLRRRFPDADDVLDFGAGRGWLLEALLAGGLRRLAALDSSAAAVRWATERGIEAHLLQPAPVPVLPSLRIAPRFLVVLDVLEHFAPEHLRAAFDAMTRPLAGSLEAVVVKVPVTDGILFKIAAALARAGAPGVLERLFLVDDVSPHRTYFSRRSLERLLATASFRIVDDWGDPDFDPATLLERAKLPHIVPRPLAAAAAATLYHAAQTANRNDSRIIIATR